MATKLKTCKHRTSEVEKDFTGMYIKQKWEY